MFEQRQLFCKGHTQRDIAQLLNIPKSTVADIITRYEKQDRIDSLQYKECPEKLTKREKQLLVRKIKKNASLSAPNLASELQKETDTLVQPETVH